MGAIGGAARIDLPILPESALNRLGADTLVVTCALSGSPLTVVQVSVPMARSVPQTPKVFCFFFRTLGWGVVVWW